MGYLARVWRVCVVVLVVLACAGVFVGCSHIATAYRDYNAAVSDAALVSDMQVHSQQVKTVVTGLASLIPVIAPYAASIGQGCGVVALGVLGIVYGRRKRKGGL